MNSIDLTLPPHAVILNYLYHDMTPADLTQDMLTVRLANGYYIDVGWYPEHDPSGEFFIRVFHGCWDRQAFDRAIKVRAIEQVRFHVEKLAQRFSQEIVAFSSAQSKSHSQTSPMIFA